MVPDLQCTVSFDLAHDSIRSRDTMMRSLEDTRYFVRNRDREYEEVS